MIYSWIDVGVDQQIKRAHTRVCPYEIPFPSTVGVDPRVYPDLLSDALEMTCVAALDRDDNIDPSGIYGQGRPSPP